MKHSIGLLQIELMKLEKDLNRLKNILMDIENEIISKHPSSYVQTISIVELNIEDIRKAISVLCEGVEE